MNTTRYARPHRANRARSAVTRAVVAAGTLSLPWGPMGWLNLSSSEVLVEAPPGHAAAPLR